MRIASWNVNGLRAVHKKGHWDEFLASVAPDIVCLQETKAEPEQLPAEVRDAAGYCAFFSSSKGRKGYSGTAIYSRTAPRSVIHGMDEPEFDQEGRLVGAEYSDFWLLDVYFPNGGQGPHRIDFKLRYYDAFLAFCEKLRAAKPIIFCGDVNTAHEEADVARPEEWSRGTGFLPEERAWLDEVVNAGYVDVWRRANPTRTGAYTYWDYFRGARERNVGWRIDYFFASNELVGRIKNPLIHADIFGSDHCPISIEVT